MDKRFDMYKKIRVVLPLVFGFFLIVGAFNIVRAQGIQSDTIPYVIHSQPEIYSFAFMTDTHIAVDAQSVDELIACVEDINTNPALQFVIVSGDVTEFGSDKEIRLAKSILDRLKVPYYVVPGNHDSKWSESGTNTFSKVFGYEHFDIDFKGIRILGAPCGPNMRMSPAMMPRESVVWLEEKLQELGPDAEYIFVNHYPMDSSMVNYYQVLDILKKGNIQLIMGGHWHRNVILDYEGIPGLLHRSTQTRGYDGPGYSIVSLRGSEITVSEKVVGFSEPRKWYSTLIGRKSFRKGWQPSYDVNDEYSQVKTVWRLQDNSDIGAGAVASGDYVIYTTTSGYVKAVDINDGSLKWSYQTGGKIYSTPAIEKGKVVVGSADNNIYCLDLKSGKLLWSYECDKSVLASPAIFKNVVYIGSSDGRFRAIDLKKGVLKWTYPNIKDFIEAKAYVDKQQVVIGDWGNTLYSFNPKTGALQWTWKNKGSRMLSPAAVWPVKANNKIFFVTPQRKSFAVEAAGGVTVWSAAGGREAIGISPAKDYVYVKTMKDSVFAISTASRQPEFLWKTNAGFGYEISPTPITSYPLSKKSNSKDSDLKGSHLVLVPTDKGEIYALDSATGNVVWRHKVSHSLINYVQPLADRQLLVSTMDGIVVKIQF